MHMISKKDLSDAEMDTLTKSCSPTIVITANGEVQTHEEANVYVKELYIYLTMKVLENTLAVLSLGKLCDENGYSHEWINGQKPHLIKDGIRILCNRENFVPIVVPGLSCSSSGSSSISRTPSRQESHSSSSSSVSSSSPTVSETQTREREDRIESDISPVQVSTSVDDRSEQPDETTMERGNPLNSEIPEWLQEFRENFGGWWNFITRTLSRQFFSLMKLLQSRHSRDVTIWVSTVFILTSIKTEIAKSVKMTKITRAPCRRRNGEAVPRATNFGDLITADHKEVRISKQSSIRSRGAGSSHSMDPGVSLQKKKLLKKYKIVCKSSWSQIGSQKSFTLPIPWNSAKLVKISPGTIARLHHTDQKLMWLLKEQCAE